MNFTVVNILKIYFMENHLEKGNFYSVRKENCSVNAVINSFKRLNKHDMKLGNIYLTKET